MQKISVLHTQKVLIILSLLIRLIALASASLIAEEAYYWNYANHLDFSYLDHPPMVAVLIKLSTSVFGISEFGVRFASFMCWGVCVAFSYQLTRRLSPSAGIKAIFLLSILPFFFLHALIITPDAPLIAAWSGCLYYLYKALVEKNPTAWYWLGLCLGLGMLAKYSIVLLGPATLVYLALTRQLRRVLLSSPPYCAILIALILFSPVIYWNATHEWASFLFQSTRRFHSVDDSSFLAFLGLLVLFLTPIGLLGLAKLFKTQSQMVSMPAISLEQKRFIQCFTLVPLFFFACFSLMHTIKFNWIGPAFLALIPWLAIWDTAKISRSWLWLGVGLLIGYMVFIIGIVFGRPETLYRAFLTKYIDWKDFNQQVHQAAENIQQTWHKPLVLLPIDRYNLASELAYYQAQAYQHDNNHMVFPVIGSDRLGYEALMYSFWSKNIDLTDHLVILISEREETLNKDFVKNETVSLSPIQQFWSHNQGSSQTVIPYYYQLVRFKTS